MSLWEDNHVRVIVNGICNHAHTTIRQDYVTTGWEDSELVRLEECACGAWREFDREEWQDEHFEEEEDHQPKATSGRLVLR